MGIIDDYRTRLENFKNEREFLSNHPKLPDAPYLIMQLDAQIRDTETRLEKLTSIRGEIKCSQCGKWVSMGDEKYMGEVGDNKICPSCIKTISQVYTANEAEEKWGLKTGRIKQDIRRKKLEEYRNAGLIRQSGKYWLIHELVKEYYDNKKKTVN